VKKLWSVLKVIGGLLWFAGLAIWTLLSWRRVKDAKTAGESARKEKADELDKMSPGEIVYSLPNAGDVRDVLRRHSGAGGGPGDPGHADAGTPAEPSKLPAAGIWGKGSIFRRKRVD
jgi:hypothetical protein